MPAAAAGSSQSPGTTPGHRPYYSLVRTSDESGGASRLCGTHHPEWLSLSNGRVQPVKMDSSWLPVPSSVVPIPKASEWETEIRQHNHHVPGDSGQDKNSESHPLTPPH